MKDLVDDGGLPPPIIRALAFERARQLTETIISKVPNNQLLQKYAYDMETCGLYLLIRHYYETGEIRVRGSYSCKHRVCCPLCAVRSARKNAGELATKIAPLMPQRFQLVTITQPDYPDYKEATRYMKLTHKRFMAAWRNGRDRLSMESFFNHYHGGYYSIELKRGTGSGLAHPHIHYLMHGRGVTTEDWVKAGNDPRRHPLSVELKQRNPLGGYICDVRNIEAETEGELKGALMEVCKYVHDFKMSVDEVWTIQQAIYRQRMSGSFGSLRGINLSNDPDDLIDEKEAKQFIEHVLSWKDGSYSMEEICLGSFYDLIDDASCAA